MVVAGDRIAAVGPAAEVLSGFTGLICDHGGGAILPGVVNCHVHLEFSALSGKVAPQAHWEDWLEATLAAYGALAPGEVSTGIACAIETFKEEFTLEADAHIASTQLDGDRVAIRRAGRNGTEETEYFDFVLAATGRIPNVAGIGLDRTTLKLDAKGSPSFDPVTTRTASADGASPIFIAGDASNFIPLLHEAADEGRIAGQNAAHLALGRQVKPGLRRAPIGVVFTDPQIGIVGGGFHSLKAGSFATGQVSFEDQGRSRILLKNKGLLNIYGDLVTGRFLGAEMLAPAAEHLAHLLSRALQNRMTVAQMLEMPFYHPVIEEGLRTALHDLDVKLRAAQTVR